MNAPKLFGVPMRCINRDGGADAFYAKFAGLSVMIEPDWTRTDGGVRWHASTPNTYDSGTKVAADVASAVADIEEFLRDVRDSLQAVIAAHDCARLVTNSQEGDEVR